MPEELWTEVRDIVQKAVIKATFKKKKCRKQNDCLRRPYETAKETQMYRTVFWTLWERERVA